MPITAEDNPRNFITKITNYEKICSMSNSMSVLPDLLPLVIEMMESICISIHKNFLIFIFTKSKNTALYSKDGRSLSSVK